MDSWLEWDSPQPKEWGVSPPRSLDGPVDADLHRTRALEKFLDHTGISKGVDHWNDEVLSELFVIANSWVESIAAQKAEVVDEIPRAVLFYFRVMPSRGNIVMLASFLFRFVSVFILQLFNFDRSIFLRMTLTFYVLDLHMWIVRVLAMTGSLPSRPASVPKPPTPWVGLL